MTDVVMNVNVGDRLRVTLEGRVAALATEDNYFILTEGNNAMSIKPGSDLVQLIEKAPKPIEVGDEVWGPTFEREDWKVGTLLFDTYDEEHMVYRGDETWYSVETGDEWSTATFRNRNEHDPLRVLYIP